MLQIEKHSMVRGRNSEGLGGKKLGGGAKWVKDCQYGLCKGIIL